jgi:hypothetical protein
MREDRKHRAYGEEDEKEAPADHPAASALRQAPAIERRG